MDKIRKSFFISIALVLLLILAPAGALAASGGQDGLTVELTTDKNAYNAGDTVKLDVKITNTNNKTVNNTKVDISLPQGLMLNSDSNSIAVGSLVGGGVKTYSLSVIASASSTTSDSISTSDLITQLPDNYTLSVGELVGWTPQPAGGTWTFDNDSLSMIQNGDVYTFKALKDGKTTATYTVNGVSHAVDITVNSDKQSIFSHMGGNIGFILFGILLVLIGAAVLIRYRKKLFSSSPKLLSIFLCFILFAGIVLVAPVQAATMQKSFTVQHSIQVDGITSSISATTSYSWEQGSSGSSRSSTSTPTYTLLPLHITGQGNAYGTVAIDGGNPAGNPSGATVKVEATPEPGYIFVGWVETDSRTATPIVGAGAEYTFTITANTTLYAIFTGDGSINPLEIATEAELDAVRNDLTLDYRLLNDITLTNTWTPIGDSSDFFIGSFDGGGHTITFGNGVDSVEFAGLFGVIGTSGEVRNLAVGGDISVSSLIAAHIGGIAGYNFGTIENCAMLGSVSTSGGDVNNVGGIAGVNDGTTNNCYSTGDVSASSSDVNYVGGIAGMNVGTTNSCYTTGAVSASGGLFTYVGGITGWSGGAITNCYTTGAVSASGGTDIYAGGIAGYSNGGINNCVVLNSGVTVSSGTNIGRIVGYNDAGTLANNRAIEISSLPNGASNNKNGMTIGTGDVTSAAFWNDTTNGIWKDVIGTANNKPWVVADGELPHLYWQTTAPSLPMHFAGTTTNPLTISTAAGLAAIANGLDKHYKLIGDINVGADWTPIGSTSATAFTGSLNGNGYTVAIGWIKSGLAADSGDVYVGLFGYNAGTIERLAVTGAVAYDGSSVYIGSIAGWNAGTIKQCSSTASVTATATDQARAGGIAGYSSGSITNCYTTGAITATSYSVDAYAGGIVGELEGALSNCYATGNVTANGNAGGYAGGIAGVNNGGGNIANCVALNSQIKYSSSSGIGRVVGGGSTGLTNNYGSMMMVRDPDASWYSQNNGIDGADVTPANRGVETWWKTTSALGWDWSATWEVSDGNYPQLK